MTTGTNSSAARLRDMLNINPDAQFEARKVDPEIAARYGAKFSQGVFRFAYRNRGVLKYEKCRDLDKKFWIEPAGEHLQLWNLDSIQDLPSKPDLPLIITEGELDGLSFLHVPGNYVVSVPNGAPSTPTAGKILIAEDRRFSFLWGPDERLIPEVDQFDKIILATDGDGPGQVLRDELALRIGEERCWFVEYPKGCKDGNDALMRYGVRGITEILKRARPMRPGKLVPPSGVPPMRYEQTYNTGWDCLDPHLRLIRPEFMVVTGIPGHGKSQWVRSLCCHMAEEHGFRSAFLVPEDPAHRVKRDLRRFAMRPRYDPKYSGLPPKCRTEEEAAAWMDAHFRISMPHEDDQLTMEFVEAEMASAALHHDCQMFVLDPWNEVTHNLGGLTETQYIEAKLPDLKRRARRYGLALIIVAHPRKVIPGEEATLYSISGSANWKNKCDHGIIISRACDSNKVLTKITKVCVEKSKDNETMGEPGEVCLEFIRDNADYGKFTT
jgi:twinkle protein